MTRPDIAYASSQLARHLTRPGPKHLRAAVRVLLYLKHTASRCLTYAPHEARPFEVFVDSSWGPHFSISGTMFFMYGCLFHWFSKSQRSVALSSAEAEFFGAMLAARDVIFVRELLFDLLRVPQEGPTIMYTDSKSAIDMSFDPTSFKKTKHILRASHFLRDLVVKDVVRLVHLPGTSMIADILTKAVARALFLQLLALLAEYSESGVAHLLRAESREPS